MADNSVADCPVCGMPTPTHYDGENVICAYCRSPLIAEGITIPTGLFWGLVAFTAGVFLGPAILGATKSGQRWMTEHAKGG